VHVRKAGGYAKVWLLTYEFAYAGEFNPVQLTMIRQIVVANQAQLLEAWHDYFG
jgi:hypothetical protein